MNAVIIVLSVLATSAVMFVVSKYAAKNGMQRGGDEESGEEGEEEERRPRRLYITE